MKAVSSIAYSSSANLGPGYDVLAVAHTSFHDRVSVAVDNAREGDQIRIVSDSTPVSVRENTAGLALSELFSAMDVREQVTVRIEKGVPFGLGMGSSGASSAAAVNSANELLALGLTRDEMVNFAMKGEIAASGSPHADNVSASIYGDMIIVSSIDPLRVRRVKVSPSFSFLTVIPDTMIPNKTRTAREMVPASVPMSSVVSNSRYISSLIAGLITGDRDLVREGMNDCIVEEARSPLFPFYREIKMAALELGAAGVAVSGAGPSTLVVCDESTDPAGIEKRVGRIMEKHGHKWSAIRSGVAGGVIHENIDAYS